MLSLVKHNSILGAGDYNRKNIFLFGEVLSLISFLKNPEKKNIFLII